MKKILEKIFGGAATGVAEGLAGIVDKFVRTKEEKDAFAIFYYYFKTSYCNLTTSHYYFRIL